ncbi:MAG TPA: SDR family NAD(P)-dependent oxidoreductase, partial [Caulobacteraceae bacterium]|nr:SDR family NAD(P)-dependent oxidoreductase [Caulobacteraceae bacterium]
MYLERLRLDGRVAFVTGGASGIGLAIAEALGEAGANVVIGDRRADLLGGAVEALTAKGQMAAG